MTPEFSRHARACAGFAFGVCRHTFRRRPSFGSGTYSRRSARARHSPAHAPENHTQPSRHARYVVVRSRRDPPRVPRPDRGATRSPGRRRSRSRACLFQHMWIATHRSRASPPITDEARADIPSHASFRFHHHRREERDDRACGRRLPGRRAGAGDARCDFRVDVRHRG